MKYHYLFNLLVLWALFFGGTLQAIPVTLPQNGLVAYYTFDGTLEDSAGTNDLSNGTNPAPSASEDRFGNSNSALNFDGTPLNVRAGNPVIPAGATTIAFYMKRTGDSPGTEFHILGSNNITANFGTRIHLDENNSFTPRWFMGKGTQGDLNFFTQGSTSIGLDEWIHLAFTWDGTTSTDGVKIYVNGVLDGTGTAQEPITNPGSDNLFIGGLESGRGHVGDLDDVAIWNRALSDSEVFDIVNFDNTINAVPEAQSYILCLIAIGAIFFFRKNIPLANNVRG